MFRSLLQPRCIESQVSNKFWIPFGNAPLALSECHLVTPSKLQWLQWDDEKVSCMCFCGTSFWKEMKGWKLKNQQEPSAFSRFGRRRDIGFALHTYIYIYTHIHMHIYIYIYVYKSLYYISFCGMRVRGMAFTATFVPRTWYQYSIRSSKLVYKWLRTCMYCTWMYFMYLYEWYSSSWYFSVQTCKVSSLLRLPASWVSGRSYLYDQWSLIFFDDLRSSKNLTSPFSTSNTHLHRHNLHDWLCLFGSSPDWIILSLRVLPRGLRNWLMPPTGTWNDRSFILCRCSLLKHGIYSFKVLEPLSILVAIL